MGPRARAVSLVLSREAWATGAAHRWLEQRRDGSGVVSLGDNRWAVVSHRAALEVLTDARRFTSRFGTGPHHMPAVPGASLNWADPPQSTQLRRLLGRLSAPALEHTARTLLAARPRDRVRPAVGAERPSASCSRCATPLS